MNRRSVNIKELFCLVSLIIIGFPSGVVLAQDTVMHFTFSEATGTPYIREEVSNSQFPVSNLFNAPERIEAVQGTALRLDGYSTYAENTYNITAVSRQMTIEAWYATEAFPPSTDVDRRTIEGGGIISQISNDAGFALEVGSYGNISLDFYADGQRYEISTPGSIQKYVWNHIVATIDLDAQQAQIFVNGSLWKTSALGAHNAISFASMPMYIGRHNATALLEGFNLTTLNGALDELKVYNSALTEAEIIARYVAFAPPAVTITLFEDFEGTDFGAWTVEGNAFGAAPATGNLEGQHPVEGFMGSQLANSFHGGDESQGRLISPEFTIEHELISLLVGGGRHSGRAEVRLLVNGGIVRTATGNDSEVLFEKSWNVSEFIGVTGRIEIIDEVSGGWGHILVDHITFSDQQELLEADLTIYPAVRHAGDHLRPQYHSMPNTSWTNEPYGLTYYNGEYHLFFQKNPNGPYLHFMHWGHLSSPDLIHWQEEKIALAPSPGFDDFGVWSGTTIMDQNNEPVIFYTGVDLGKAGIGLAYPKDEELIEWEKSPHNPVIANRPAGFLDFRDPYLWKDGETYYMIIGGGLTHNGGGALPTYKSTDLVNWTPIDPLYRSSNQEVSGFYWEMPLFYPLNDQGEYVLAVTPLFSDKPANVIYWVGKWENETFTPYSTSPKLLEPVRDNMLAPAIGTDEAGRITYIGIIPESRNVEDQLRAGWRHTFSLPRVIRLLEDSALGQYPHPNLCRLRTNEVSVTDRLIGPDSNNNLPEFSGNQINLSFQLKADSASSFSLQLLKNADGTQFTSIDFDLAEHRLALDTRQSHARAAAREYKEAEYVFDPDKEIHIEIFIDHSIVEVFIDNLVVLSVRVYPAETSQNVDLLVSRGEIEIVEASQWNMQGMGSSTGTEVCEPDILPVAFPKRPEDLQPTGLREKEHFKKFVNLYPNPATGEIRIQAGIAVHETSLTVTDLSGKEIMTVHKNYGGAEEIALDVHSLPAGIYVLKLKAGNRKEVGRFMIRR